MYTLGAGRTGGWTVLAFNPRAPTSGRQVFVTSVAPSAAPAQTDSFLPLTPAVIHDHLRGEREGGSEREFVVGIYPLLTD